MIKRLPATLFACGSLCFAAPDSPSDTPLPADAGAPRPGTITEQTPSIPQYFTWINNTIEGATEEQTLINLRFFKWLHDEFGMRLGIYAFDAGAIDSQEFYGRMDGERFRKQFPDGWKEIAELARSFDCRLGLWGGPHGFGDTPEEEAARTDLLVGLCRDYGLQLFKFDSVCGQLRDHKQQAFMNAMTGCRQHAPDLVVLNHRLNLSEEAITPVKEARDAFFNQELFWRRGIWDKYLFDRLDETFLSTFHYQNDKRIAGGCLRVDLGTTLEADMIRIKTLHDPRNGKPIPAEMPAEIGTALDAWHPVVFKPVDSAANKKIAVAEITKNGGQHELHDHDLRHWEAKVLDGTACRYLRLAPAPDRTAEVGLWRKGKQLEIPARSRATALFAPYDQARAELAWQAEVSLPSHPAPNSYLCVALNGEHGRNGAYAALRMDGQWIGAPQRAVSYPAVVFEYPPANPSSNFTYFFPITQEMHGRSLEVVVLGLAGCDPALKPEVWTTTYPYPYESVEMVLE